jgi:MFS family permease
MAPLGERLMPVWAVGFLIGGGSLLLLALDVPAGHLLDRFGYRRLLKVTTIVFLAGAAALLLDFNIITYGIAFIVGELGWLFFGPGVNAYVLSHAPREDAGKFISLRDVSGSLGVVLASGILGLVLGLSTQVMGGIICTLLAAALIFLWFSPKDRQSARAEKKIETHHWHIRRRHPWKALKVIKKLNPASMMLLLLSLSSSIFYGIVWFVVPIVIAHEADTGMLSLGLGVFDFAVVALGFALGSLADKGNKRTLIFFGLLLFSVSAFILSFNFNWLFLLFGFLATAGDEMASISLWSWLHALDRDHDADGIISSVINLAQDLGWAVGPAAAGVLYMLIGPSWTIATGAVLLFRDLAYRPGHRSSSPGSRCCSASTKEAASDSHPAIGYLEGHF